MPSMLHILQVDKYAVKNNNNANTAHNNNNNNNESPRHPLEDILSANYGGMNWGVIAVYTCPSQSCSNKEEVLVLQASVDEVGSKKKTSRHCPGLPPKMMMDAPDCIIPDDQTFDAQTDDGNFVVGCNDGDFDDDETVVGEEEDMVFTPDDQKEWWTVELYYLATNFKNFNTENFYVANNDFVVLLWRKLK